MYSCGDLNAFLLREPVQTICILVDWTEDSTTIGCLQDKHNVLVFA